jgi:RimJ/RimL family protein N-acetyltransferase
MANRTAVLAGQQVAIRPFDLDDALFLRDASNDLSFQAAAYPGPLLPRGLVEFQRRLQAGDHAPLSGAGGAFEFAVARRSSTLDAVGVAGLYQVDWHNRHAELGVSIVTPKERRSGLGIDANATMLDYAFGHLSLQRVWGHVKADNEPALRLCERLGYRLEGTLRAHRLRGTDRVDLCVVGILREEWPGNFEARSTGPSRPGS